MVQQFDELMQHDGDRRDPHAMLRWKHDQDGNENLKKIIIKPVKQYLQYLGKYMSLSCQNWFCNTYTYREHWSHFIHAVAVSSCTDIYDFLWVSRQFQLLVDELGKSLHSIRAAANTHKLWEREKEDKRILFSSFRNYKLIYLVFQLAVHKP